MSTVIAVGVVDIPILFASLGTRSMALLDSHHHRALFAIVLPLVGIAIYLDKNNRRHIRPNI
jgi:hypothetical protein